VDSHGRACRGVTYAKRYRSGGGAHMALAFDSGPTVNGGVRFPHGTMTAVDCPDCPAAAGGKCVAPSGNIKTQVHISRRRMAIRKYYADREAEETSL
jgi:hypothetical protein